jgi:hypothetical protein
MRAKSPVLRLSLPLALDQAKRARSKHPSTSISRCRSRPNAGIRIGYLARHCTDALRLCSPYRVKWKDSAGPSRRFCTVTGRPARARPRCPILELRKPPFVSRAVLVGGGIISATHYTYLAPPDIAQKKTGVCAACIDPSTCVHCVACAAS